MRFVLIILAVCGSLFCLVPQSAAQSHLELFGGYSYVRPSVPVVSPMMCPSPICVLNSTQHPNLNGWELAATYKIRPFIGLTADFSGHYGDLLGSSMRLNTYLFGPKLSLPGPISPFIHALAGGAHESFNGGVVTNSAFAAAVGGGLDIKLIPRVSLRAIQVDYLLTRFNSDTQHQPRISAGLVLNF